VSAWRPTTDEATFLGQLLVLDAGLADIARGMLERGIPLREVVAAFKAATDIARMVQVQS
jgi:hypothetical protein